MKNILLVSLLFCISACFVNAQTATTHSAKMYDASNVSQIQVVSGATLTRTGSSAPSIDQSRGTVRPINQNTSTLGYRTNTNDGNGGNTLQKAVEESTGAKLISTKESSFRESDIKLNDIGDGGLQEAAPKRVLINTNSKIRNAKEIIQKENITNSGSNDGNKSGGTRVIGGK